MTFRVDNYEFKYFYQSFLEQFGRIFSNSNRMYGLSFFCKNDDLCEELFAAIKFLDNGINTFIISHSDDFKIISVCCCASREEELSLIKENLNKILNIVADINDRVIICGMNFSACQKTKFSDTQRILKSVKRTIAEIKGNENIGNLSYPKEAEDDFILDWDKECPDKAFELKERFVIPEDMSENSIKLGFYGCKEKSFADYINEINTYLSGKWDTIKLTDCYYQFVRKNLLDEAEEIITVVDQQDINGIKGSLLSPEMQGILKEKRSDIYNDIISRKVFYKLIFYSRDKNALFTDERFDHFTNGFDDLFSISFEFIHK